MSERPKDHRSKTAVSRTIYVGQHSGPRRISLDQLDTLITELRVAVAGIQADLGLSDEGVGSVELVDFVDGSGGLQFEQSTVESSFVPLALAVDCAVLHMRGEPLPAILTMTGTAAITRFSDVLRRSATPDVPIRLGTAPRPESPLAQAAYEVSPMPTVAPEQAVEAIEKASLSAADSLIKPGEWLLTFTGVLEKLDGIHRKMWVNTTRGTARAPLNPALFATADEDDMRWHRVTAVCIAGSPGVDKIRDTLHVRPAYSGAPDWKEVPMNEAARDISAVLDKIDAIGALKPGWDSYKAVQPSVGARQAARGFLLLAASVFATENRAIKLPFAAPTPDGRVQLEWETGEVYLELTFSASGSIEYLRMLGDDSVEERATRDRAIELLKWFHGRAFS